jgi:cell division protease FtsH
MAGRFGMSRLGRVRVLREQGEIFLGRDYLATHDVSQPTLEHLDTEISRILDEQEHTARTILEQHRAVLISLTATLIGQETVQGPELERLLGDVRMHQTATAGVGAGSNGAGTVPARRPRVRRTPAE